MTTFTDIGVSPTFVKALAHIGFENPTPIQEEAIPHVLKGSDIFGCAQTGTGKTGAFMIPTLQKLHQTTDDSAGKRQHGIRALVLTPTRELAIQIGEGTKSFAARTNLRYTVIHGGVSDKPQIKKIQAGVDVLIATPGRLLDLINQRKIKLSQIETFILDEADRMLDMGFIHDIKKLAKLLPTDRQTLFFSATFAPKVMQLAHQFLTNPIKIEIAPQSSTVDTVKQSIYTVDKENKNKLLLDILGKSDVHDAIVFSRTKHGANKIEKLLLQAGISAGAIHGNKSQSARQKALKKLKTGEIKVLVATDVAARGIDISKLSTVIIYDVPVEAESYVHRIGRTGRAGQTGQSFMMVCHEETTMLKAVFKLIGKNIATDPDHKHHVDIDIANGRYPQYKQGGGSRGRGGRSGGGNQRGNSQRRNHARRR